MSVGERRCQQGVKRVRRDARAEVKGGRGDERGGWPGCRLHAAIDCTEGLGDLPAHRLHGLVALLVNDRRDVAGEARVPDRLEAVVELGLVLNSRVEDDAMQGLAQLRHVLG